MSIDERTQLLREILKWIRFSGMKEVKNVIGTTLDTEQKKWIYQLSDGQNSSYQISGKVGVSDDTVRRYWKMWAKVGIVERLKAGKGDRHRRAFDLEELGIEIAELGTKADTVSRREYETQQR